MRLLLVTLFVNIFLLGYQNVAHAVFIDNVYKPVARSTSTLISQGRNTLASKIRIGAFLLRTKSQAYQVATGTKWCGMGSRAENDDELGELTALDSCCMQHDKCTPPREQPLTHQGFITLSSCACDLQFRKCLNQLERAGDSNAEWVKELYFNVLNMPCIPQ